MRLIFMGTPDFAVGTLEALLAAGHEVALVVTQPDKPKGRGKALQFSPVKEAALSRQIPVYQPRRVRDAESVAYLSSFAPDLIVVVAFGQILPKEVLDLPKHCCVNVHASLLPKYRGAAPIQWAILNGEDTTGVTTMRMDEGMDTGDIILTEEVPLLPDETGGSLFGRLAEVGAKLCVRTLSAIEDGSATFTPQEHGLATYTTMIKKEMGRLDFGRSAIELERLIRGLNPWPSAYTRYGDKTLKVWKAGVEAQGSRRSDEEMPPGTVVCAEKGKLLVQTGEGLLSLLEVQLEGKKRMDIGAFLRGNPVPVGYRFPMADELGNDAAR